MKEFDKVVHAQSSCKWCSTGIASHPYYNYWQLKMGGRGDVIARILLMITLIYLNNFSTHNGVVAFQIAVVGQSTDPPA